MRVLIDTQSLIWYVDQDQLLSRVAHAAITNPKNILLVSAATPWEIAIKVSIKKLSLSLPYRMWVNKALTSLRAKLLPIELDYTERHLSLAFHHRDPFDRMIAAQALVEGIPVVSSDAIFDTYGVQRLWN